ncbi:putative very-long-chain 3-oxoacyl-CoA reductase [Helianthus debilis subsp. tardiflorus]
MELDLSSMASLRNIAAKYQSSGLPLHVLIYSSIYAYGLSKLANILHANELARLLKGAATTCYLALNPRAKGVTSN